MSKKIQIKRGLKVGLPTLNEGELGYATDTKELFIGTASGNEPIVDVEIPEETGLANVEFYTTTIATGDWTGSDPVTATKTVSGILSTDSPIIDIDLSLVAFASIEDFQAEYGKLFRVAATDDDEITFYALEAPTEDLVIQIQVVR